MQDLLDRGRYLAAVRLAGELEDSPAVRLLTARGLLSMGRWQDGLAQVVPVLDTGMPDERAVARYYAGIATLELGDPGAAEEHLLAALAGPLPAQHTAAAQYNLARAYGRLQQPDTAISMYRRAAAGFATRGDSWHLLRARQNLAWLLLCQGQTGAARAELDDALPLLRDGSPEQAHQLTLEAIALAQIGQIAEAARICEELLTSGHPAATSWDRCCAAWLAGELARQEGRPDLAREMLTEAERHADRAQDPRLWNRIGDLRRYLADT